MRVKFVLFLEFYLVVPLKKFAEEKPKGNEIRTNRKNKKTKRNKKKNTPRGGRRAQI